MLGPDGAVGKRVLDVYAGTGAVGFDLLEHGAEHVDFVEINRKRAEAIQHQAKLKGFDTKTQVHRGDAIRMLSTLQGNRYDIVFADPPYESDPWNDLISTLRNTATLNPDAWIIAEHSSRKTMPETLAGANAINSRKYGDSAITVYRVT